MIGLTDHTLPGRLDRSAGITRGFPTPAQTKVLRATTTRDNELRV
jgi:hypothetical protein